MLCSRLRLLDTVWQAKLGQAVESRTSRLSSCEEAPRGSQTLSNRCIGALAVVTVDCLVSYAVALVRCGGSRDSVHAAQTMGSKICAFDQQWHSGKTYACYTSPTLQYSYLVLTFTVCCGRFIPDAHGIT